MKMWGRELTRHNTRINKFELQNIKRLPLAFLLLYTQLTLIIIFVAFGEYCPDSDASDPHNSINQVHGGFQSESNTLLKYDKRNHHFRFRLIFSIVI